MRPVRVLAAWAILGWSAVWLTSTPAHRPPSVRHSVSVVTEAAFASPAPFHLSDEDRQSVRFDSEAISRATKFSRSSRSLATPRPRLDGAHRFGWTDDPFDALSACEAGMNPTRVNASGKFRGAFQFSLATWHGIGENGDPIDYDYAYQKVVAQHLKDRSGWGQWPQCARNLGLL